MAYCDGSCEHLNYKKHICEKTEKNYRIAKQCLA